MHEVRDHEGFRPLFDDSECSRTLSGRDCYHTPPRRPKYLVLNYSVFRHEKFEYELAPDAFVDSGPEDAPESAINSDDGAETMEYLPEWDPTASVGTTDLEDVQAVIDSESVHTVVWMLLSGLRMIWIKPMSLSKRPVVWTL